MKNTFYLAFLIFLFTISTWAQSSCGSYYPLERGTTSEITTYSKKGKIAAITTNTVINFTGAKATIESILKDKTNKVLTQTNFEVQCTADGVEIDIKSMLSPQLFDQFNGMETDIKGTNVKLPNTLTVGQTLPDAMMQMNINMSGIVMNMEVEMKNRKVVGTETITTPAGTFDCFVIEYTSLTKMGMSRTGKAKQWIAKNVGMVKQEDYNRNGKVTSNSLLTAFNN